MGLARVPRPVLRPLVAIFFPILPSIPFALLCTLRNTPFFGSFPPLRAFDTALVTAEKAFLEFEIVPFLPYELLDLTIFMPSFTARLNFVIAFLRLDGILTPGGAVEPVNLRVRSAVNSV